MTVFAQLELQLQPEALEKAYQVLREVLVDTRAFDGCLGVDVLIDGQDPAHVVVHERWASLEHDAAYREWRAGDGASDLGTVLAGPPKLTLFTLAADI
jgi:quinol monooxygenase YgiN